MKNAKYLEIIPCCVETFYIFVFWLFDSFTFLLGKNDIWYLDSYDDGLKTIWYFSRVFMYANMCLQSIIKMFYLKIA